ncbi:MAG: SUMF1/EgtB/PvdO family nonheme iron enzyme, partial [Bacteroidales bacterium]|nr:SUMF1/EgtB/PvdO family nonheme iron enzyme [Bacteroidales bacterium]
YNMGESDQDVPYTQMNATRTVSVQAFYMDETEITNNEYRQFVNWVRDSIAHTLLGQAQNPEELGEHFISDRDGNVIDFGDQMPYNLINWREEIRWDEEPTMLVLEDPNYGIFLPEHERYYRVKQIDTRKLNFEYYWINFRDAAKRSNRPQGQIDRSQFIEKRIDNIFPDTLAWVHDFSYSFNEPMTQNYFWHPAYDHYPVVGVSWLQATAFSIWRTGLKRSYHQSVMATFWNDFRLPNEAEWEWAARGGLDLNPFPWGGPYTRNSNGCFLANFKPLRGNYVDDGGFHTLIVAHFAPNDYGLYDMAGNVSEWCDDSFDPSTYRFAHDMNTHFSRDANDNLSTSNKRRVIRGGSWKDIGFYMRTSTRSYEYQDTAKSYIGFRNVQTYLGRAKGDGPSSSAVYR